MTLSTLTTQRARVLFVRVLRHTVRFPELFWIRCTFLAGWLVIKRRAEMKCSSSDLWEPRLDRPWQYGRQPTANHFYPRQNSRPDVRRYDLGDTTAAGRHSLLPESWAKSIPRVRSTIPQFPFCRTWVTDLLHAQGVNQRRRFFHRHRSNKKSLKGYVKHTNKSSRFFLYLSQLEIF